MSTKCITAVKALSFAVITFCFLHDVCNAQTPSESNSLRLVATIPLPGVSGRIDHLAFDQVHQTLFAAALGNNTVEVVDLINKNVIHTIRNLSEPQGVAFIPESGHLFVANGGNGECDIFDASSFRKVNSIQLSGDADNVRYDSSDNKIYVGYGDGGIAIIDASNYKQVADIKLSGHPESFQLDKTDKKIYANVPDKKQIEVVDLKLNAVTDRWIMSDASSNFPMSLDEANHVIFIGCRHPAMLIAIDMRTGKTITTIATDNDVDDLFYDKTSNQIYMSCGGGYLNIIKYTETNTFVSNEKIQTHSGARTSLFIPELNRLIVASPSGFNRDAALLIYNVKK